MTKSLRISSDLTLPLDTVTQTIGILARKRAGKSYLARRLTEQLIRANQQVVIVDPKGDWWGIRSAADGRAEGLKVTILGGEHGDVPLEPRGGELVAQLAVEERATMLLDTSHFSKSARASFNADFLETLYRMKAQERYRTPAMLVIDEADTVAPQKPMAGEERMLGAANDIVRRGGQRGIGCIMVSQRSAILSKDVLTQIELLVTLRMKAPQDIDAIKLWIEAHEGREQSAVMLGSLPSLPIGTAWFWSPGWPTDDGIFQKSAVLPIETFDSGATPKPGQKITPPKMVADVDLGAFQKRMADTIERKKAYDPKELRRRIAELERELAKKVPPVTKAERVEVKVPFIPDKQLRRLESLGYKLGGLSAKAGECASEMKKVTEDLLRIAAANVVKAAPAASPFAPAWNRKTQGTGNRHEPVVMSRVAPERQGKSGAQSNGTGTAELNRMERRLLTAIAQYPDGRTRIQILTLAGYRASGDVSTAFGRFNEHGWIEYVGKITRITEAGRAALGPFDKLPTGDDLIEYWKNELSTVAARLFAVFVEERGNELARKDVIARAGYKPSGDVSTAFGLLSRLELICEGRQGLTLNEEVFS